MLNRGRTPIIAAQAPAGRSWFSIKAKSDDVAEVRIYAEIGWFGIDAEEFAQELEKITASTIHLHINSPGGDVFDGNTIYNTLKQHPARVETFVDGLAASIASVVALAGDTVHMAENALFMIHNPWTFAIGDADDLRQLADVLDKVTSTIAQTYMAKTGKSLDEIKALMAAETWFTADEAIEAGFIDHKLSDDGDAADAKANFDLKVFKNAPGAEPPEKDEQADDAARVVNTQRMRLRLALAERDETSA